MTNPAQADRGECELNEKIEARGTGLVYVVSVKRGSICRANAIETLHRAPALSEGDRERLLAEARIAYELDGAPPRRQP